MKKIATLSLFFLSCFLFQKLHAQINEDKLGAWYMYFWNTTINESPWGFQGDVQYRNWNLGGDLEQLLLRGGPTFKPKDANIKFTLGYGFVLTGTFGSSDETSKESRIYQEALLPQKVGKRFYLSHRFRFEQRFVEGQDFRTRGRYFLMIRVPLNMPELSKKALYLAVYNEIFINGQKDVGNGRTVEIFDRNRTYGALGYGLGKNLKIQFGYMYQITENWKKGQLQLSLHHKI